MRRSSRITKEISRLNPSTGKDYHVQSKIQVRNSPSYTQAVREMASREVAHNLRVNDVTNLEYGLETGKVIARLIHDMRDDIVRSEESHAVQYFLKQGLKEFGKAEGKKALKAKLLQMHKRICFIPTLVKDLSPSEKRKAMLGLMILSQKKTIVVRERLTYNRRPTRN